MEPIVLVSYSDQAPQTWLDLLQKAKSSGYHCIYTRVLWGEHETLRGEKDFKKSRLRLEKFLSLAQSQSLRVILELGFPDGNKTFPGWAFSLPHKGLVPASVWFRRNLGVKLVEIPSLGNPEIASSFSEFVSEFLTRFHFYQSPDGPVEKIILNMDLFENDLAIKKVPSFFSYWQERYSTIEVLNQRYLTHFKDFNSLLLPKTSDLLFERREWLYAFDYKFCRKAIVDQFINRLLALPEAKLWKDQVIGKIHETKPMDTLSVADGTLLQITPNGDIFPFLEAGIFRKGALLNYQKAQPLRRISKLQWLEGKKLSKARLFIVLCGKYLEGKIARELNSQHRDGAQVFFPLGFPQYDENMEALAFEGPRTKILVPQNIFQNLELVSRSILERTHEPFFFY